MGDLNSLEDLFYHQLRDIYTTQQRFIKALPNLTESSSSREPGNAFRDHFEETSLLREPDTAKRKNFPIQNLKVNPIIFELIEYAPLKRSIKLVLNEGVINP